MTERRTSRTLASRLRPLVPLAAIWCGGLILLAVLLLQRRVPYAELLLDPNDLAGLPWYTGMLSNLGILGWTTGTVAGYFGTWVARYGNRLAAASMLRWGATLSAILLLDDLFQLHVAVKPLLGISKPMVYCCYLAVAGGWVAGHRREIARTRVELLLAAAAAFGTSVVVDQLGAALPLVDAQGAMLIEDAAKFLGVLAWAQYFALTTKDIVVSIVSELRDDEAAPAPAGPVDGVVGAVLVGSDAAGISDRRGTPPPRPGSPRTDRG